MSLRPSEIFKVLAVERRVKIIELLKSEGALGSKCMAKKLGISVAAVSQHLKILKGAGLVSSERNGYWIPYSIDKEKLESCRDMFNDVCTCGCNHTKKLLPSNPKCISERNDIKSLNEYENKLWNELKDVRDRIEKLKARSKK